MRVFLRLPLLMILLVVSCLNAAARYDTTYRKLVAQAGLLHLQKKVKPALLLYRQAFDLQRPDAWTAYKAAGMFALDSNVAEAFFWLERAVDSGWTETGWLLADPYFDDLRISHKISWNRLLQKALAAEQQHENKLSLPTLRREINQMAVNDQQLRYRRVQASNDSLLKLIDLQLATADRKNRARAKTILAEFGWPTIRQIGRDGQRNLWLIVQHADSDIPFQRAALAAMQKWIETDEIDLENYAFLYDRVQCNLNYKQCYGTQVNWRSNGLASGFRVIQAEDSVDIRRSSLGLDPLNIYALGYGFEYLLPAAGKAKQNEAAYRKQVTDLIESANRHYKEGAFAKAYDDYNTASTFLGGLSSRENFEAAVFFARVAEMDRDTRYPEIALDFLEYVTRITILVLLNKEMSRLLSSRYFSRTAKLVSQSLR